MEKDEMGKKIWVLTFEVNEYDQHGAYFVAAFEKLPSVAELTDFIKTSEEYRANGLHFGDALDALSFIEHLRGGGGRRGFEDMWFNLECVVLHGATP